MTMVGSAGPRTEFGGGHPLLCHFYMDVQNHNFKFHAGLPFISVHEVFSPRTAPGVENWLGFAGFSPHSGQNVRYELGWMNNAEIGAVCLSPDHRKTSTHSSYRDTIQLYIRWSADVGYSAIYFYSFMNHENVRLRLIMHQVSSRWWLARDLVSFSLLRMDSSCLWRHWWGKVSVNAT